MPQIPLILLTNDDGIESPGLSAAAKALDRLGDLLIVAPRKQQTSMGRSRSQMSGNDGRLFKSIVADGAKKWDGVAVNATPAVTVEHALLEIAQRPVSLVVSGINYGENVGTCVTVSGTIGAALEAAEHNIPALAVSLEIASEDYHSFEQAIDFTAATHFTHYFAEKALQHGLPYDVDVLKIEVPGSATTQTDWVVTRQDRFVYYVPYLEKRQNLFADPGKLNHRPSKGKYGTENTDAHALAKGLVSITPLSLDLTSRIKFKQLEEIFR